MIYEGDNWVQDGRKITSEENLTKIAENVQRTVLIVEHRHYRGSTSPSRLFVEDEEEFHAYLKQHARPGDAFCVWPFDLCTEVDAIAVGKFPDISGRVPLRGAY